MKIKSAIVYKNTRLFQRILEKYQNKPQAYFNAYIHRMTGELLFEDELTLTDTPDLKEYKPICFHYEPHDPHFEVLEDPSNTHLFACTDITPKALSLLSQMITLINHSILRMSHPDNLQEVLHHLSLEELTLTMPSHAEKDLISAAWHPATREEAETFLEHKAQGTYFFRKDEYATVLEEQLSSRYRTPIVCITLTYLKPNRAMQDLTLVQKNSHWYIYDDDPSLEETAYSSIDALLKSLQNELLESL